MILFYYKGRSSLPFKGKDTISFDLQTKCDLIIAKREQELRFDVEKSRYGGPKYDLTLSQMIRHLVYHGIRRLSSKYE